METEKRIRLEDGGSGDGEDEVEVEDDRDGTGEAHAKAQHAQTHAAGSAADKQQRNDGAGEEDDGEDEETRALVQEEHRVWKKNAPFLYDVCFIHTFSSTPLSCQWLPAKSEGKLDDYASHELLVGQRCGGGVDDAAYLNVMKVLLPPSEPLEAMPVKEFNDKTKDLGGYAGNAPKVAPILQIVHEADVDRVRYMPNDHFMVATRMGTTVAIFKYDEMSSSSKDRTCRPLIRGVGHAVEGFGLDWSQKKPGHLLSCGKDGTFVWNVDRGAGPTMSFLHHLPAPVQDCTWNPHVADQFLTVSLSGGVCCTTWDLRATTQQPVFQLESSAHGELNAVAYNPEKEHVFATGGSNKVVQIWDARKYGSGPVHLLEGHQDEIYAIQWAPFSDQVLASCGKDRRVMLWDLDRIGQEQSAEDAEDGVPELLFIHGGHCDEVQDVSWNVDDDWTLASISADGDLQVWQPAAHIITGEDDDDEDAGGEGGAGSAGDDAVEVE